MKKRVPAKTKTSAASALPGQLVDAFAGDSQVASAKMFNSPGFKIKGKFFAAFSNGKLLLKLPEARVNVLIAEGKGEPFEPMRGRIMREWVLVDAKWEREWSRLAKDARNFVASGR